MLLASSEGAQLDLAAIGTELERAFVARPKLEITIHPLFISLAKMTVGKDDSRGLVLCFRRFLLLVL